jgi:hypothetical protein
MLRSGRHAEAAFSLLFVAVAMKRERNLSYSASRLSSAAGDGFISQDQKAWLRAHLADGDPAVEEALDALAAGNSSPLRILASSGENPALRSRLQTLSLDGSVHNRFREIPSSSDASALDLLTQDLRQSSIAGAPDFHFDIFFQLNHAKIERGRPFPF